MTRVRIIIANSGDRTEEILYAARLRQLLFDRGLVEPDPDSPVRGTNRDTEARAYFDLLADAPEEVRLALAELDPDHRATVTVPPDPPGEACVNCGNIAGPILPAECPNCRFRDISPCPSCGADVPRQSYETIAGDLHVCPNCKQHVRLGFADPLFTAEGHYKEPLVVVLKAG